MTKEQLGTLVLGSERQLYSTAKAILCNDQDCADASGNDCKGILKDRNASE